MSEWSQPPNAQLEEPVAAPRVPNRSSVPVFGSLSASLLVESPTEKGFPHHRPCDLPSAISEWSQPPDAQLERYEPVATPRVPNRSGFPVFGSSLASFLAESPTEKGELCLKRKQ
ncbi:uncharacterized protein BBA_09631 [Beauveria bassiana ARSEF 2860]|uniref:Uncharacterized protein n=1 Tax=Beauveria bassiana (strain ARSEF 2860) TaxID=655819 RepID=J5JBZ7_BEAB2|nr:uncharacterized protein BBA_09631 [Beauveria bassiana ARSEF 2860]EJP61441.1 hypothetical protein BBA_09631 [Beauveria bassiana ARSEF 2860]